MDSAPDGQPNPERDTQGCCHSGAQPAFPPPSPVPWGGFVPSPSLPSAVLGAQGPSILPSMDPFLARFFRSGPPQVRPPASFSSGASPHFTPRTEAAKAAVVKSPTASCGANPRISAQRHQQPRLDSRQAFSHSRGSTAVSRILSSTRSRPGWCLRS